MIAAIPWDNVLSSSLNFNPSETYIISLDLSPFALNSSGQSNDSISQIEDLPILISMLIVCNSSEILDG